MGKHNVAEFTLKHRECSYKGKEWEEFTGSFECNGVTHLITIGAQGGVPRVYTGTKGKNEGRNFVYARSTSFRQGQHPKQKRNQSRV